MPMLRAAVLLLSSTSRWERAATATSRSDLGIAITESEAKDWAEDTGALVLKDVVAVNAVAFLNKGNVTGATPAVIEPREAVVMDLWSRITEIPKFGSHRAKEKTVAAQPVVLKALAKITYDLNFNNRRPENSSRALREISRWAAGDRLLARQPDVELLRAHRGRAARGRALIAGGVSPRGRWGCEPRHRIGARRLHSIRRETQRHLPDPRRHDPVGGEATEASGELRLDSLLMDC